MCTLIQNVYFLDTFLCYIMSSASFIFVGNLSCMESYCMIYKQIICECLLQKGVCLKSSKLAKSCCKENASSLYLAIY